MKCLRRHLSTYQFLFTEKNLVCNQLDCTFIMLNVTDCFYNKFYYKAFFLYQDSFADVPKWLDEIRMRFTEDGHCVVLVGNKCDLQDKRVVEFDTAKVNYRPSTD